MHVNHNAAAAAAAANGTSVHRMHRGSAKNDFASLIDDGNSPSQVSPRAPVPNPDAPVAVDPGQLVDDAIQFTDGTLGDLIASATSISGVLGGNSGPVNNGITANIGGGGVGGTPGSGVTNALPSAPGRKHGHHGGHHSGNNAARVIQPAVPSTPNDGSVASMKTQALSGGTSPKFSLATLLELQESNQNS